ncbi:MAG: IS1595 family transposase, partial [Burkholderiales bacterium]|nr:IS1595 family transposase [Burkholderiales bacterium]
MPRLTRCKLKKNIQLRLLEYFVLEVTARSAANMLEIQANTAI